MDLLQQDDYPEMGVMLRALGFSQPVEDDAKTMLVRYTDLITRSEVRVQHLHKSAVHVAL